jgi:hypothetical protein
LREQAAIHRRDLKQQNFFGLSGSTDSEYSYLAIYDQTHAWGFIQLKLGGKLTNYLKD